MPKMILFHSALEFVLKDGGCVKAIQRIAPTDIGDMAGGLHPKGFKPSPTKDKFRYH
jgi:hypothetical protein